MSVGEMECSICPSMTLGHVCGKRSTVSAMVRSSSGSGVQDTLNSFLASQQRYLKCQGKSKVYVNLSDSTLSHPLVPTHLEKKC